MSRIKPIFKAATPEQIAKRPNKIISAGSYIHPGIYEREIDIGDYYLGGFGGNGLQLAWSAAGAECDLNGWRLFVRDTCYRIKNDIAGVATPSLLHQDLVGNLKVVDPANEIKIGQYHPAFYWVSHKVYGKKNMYEPVKVTEPLSLPLTIGLNYKSTLTDLSQNYNIGKESGSADWSEMFYFFFKKITMPRDGYLQSISFRMSKESAGLMHYAVGIYEDNAGAVGDKIANSEIFEISTSYDDSVEVSIHCDLENTKSYWLCVQSDNEAADCFLAYDGSNPDNQAYKNAVGFPDFSDDPTGLTYSPDDLIIYATYTEKPSFARFYAEIWSSYQGNDVLTNEIIELDYNTDWKNAELSIPSVIGIPIRYDLYIHLKNLRGDLFIDNIYSEHSAQNWIRDPFCRDINQAFTRAFYQIPKHWVAESLEDGASFESIYPAD